MEALVLKPKSPFTTPHFLSLSKQPSWWSTSKNNLVLNSVFSPRTWKWHLGIFPNKITLKFYIGRFLKNTEFILKVYFSIEHEDFCISQNLGIIVASLICSAFELKYLLSSQVVLVVKNPPPWVGKSTGEGNDNPVQYSCLEISMDRGVWPATVHGAAKSWTWLSMHMYIYYLIILSFQYQTLVNIIVACWEESLERGFWDGDRCLGAFVK